MCRLLQTSIVSQLLRHGANPTLLNCNQDKPYGNAFHTNIHVCLETHTQTWQREWANTFEEVGGNDAKRSRGINFVLFSLAHSKALTVTVMIENKEACTKRKQ